MYNPGFIRLKVACLAIASCLSLFAYVALAAPSFDEQRKAVSSSTATQTEEAILSLLEAGIAEDKPTQAIAVTQLWLRENVAEKPLLLYHAGRAAEMSGDWRSAASLYQQYLKRADPKSRNVSDAVLAAYTLQIDQLNDPSAAYAFGRSEGHRLMANTRARQFDTWFLDEAVKRKDAVAVAHRLHALLKAGVSDDLRVIYYDKYFRWLLEQVDVYVEQPGVIASTDELVTSCKQLCAAMTFNEELALRLDWAVSVRSYNLAKIAEEDATPPIAEASALLAKYPRYAQWVQTGWAGGGNGQYYRGDVKKYWSHEIDAKLTPVVAAAAKLTPLQFADLLQSWRDRYYNDNVVRPLAVKVVRDYVMVNPKLINGRTGVLLLEQPWNQYTPAQAQKLAPKVAGNPHPEAALIRAIAAGGEAKDFDKMVAALIGPEAWRLSAAELDGRYADQLWHYAGRPGDSAKRDQEIAKSKAVSEKIKAAAIAKDAAPAQRIALFKKLWADYRSAQPKIPGVVASSRLFCRSHPK